MKTGRSRFSVLGSGFVFMFGFMFMFAGAAVGRALSGSPAAAALTGAVAGNTQTGQSMFTKSGCETCHGANGQGTAAGPRIAGTTRDVSSFIGYVRKPTGTMPPQSAQSISDQALTDIHAFLRSPAAARAAAAPSAPAGRADAGAALFAKIGCYQCHANQAQGGAQGPRIGPDPIPFARFAQYVRAPAGDMPPYTEKVLSNQELADIYAFLQSLPRPPAVNTIPQLAP
jgi:mono/diheme cytochrome c family protein